MSLLSQMTRQRANPFAATKAVDLTDEQIQQLWVDLTTEEGRPILKATSQMPVLLLGGKGSGKTHWMRYHSYPLQRLRHATQRLSPIEGLKADGYLGIYILLGGLNAERFSGRNQTDEVWRAVFEYYFELWIAQELLQIVISIADSEPALQREQTNVCQQLRQLIDEPPTDNVDTFAGLLQWFADGQRELDKQINNVVFGGALEPRIRITRGRLIFGLPRILSSYVSGFEGLLFSYFIDEFENITEAQQKYINTLLRERQNPTTFRIGSRTWGVKTYKTYADGEENKEGSEFETLPLDKRLRMNRKKWIEFSYRLVARRIEVEASLPQGSVTAASLNDLFERPDLTWKSGYVREQVGSSKAVGGPHFDQARKYLLRGMKADATNGIEREQDITQLLTKLAVPGFPVLEKLNLLLLYRRWFRDEDLKIAAQTIHDRCASFLMKSDVASSYGRLVQHYNADMIAQLWREAGKRPPAYCGMPRFIRMSEGLPRTLIMILKHVFDWVNYNASDDRQARVSVSDQVLGVLEASDWFSQTMRKAGDEGAAVRTGLERLAALFEANRYGDTPIHSSLLGFSVRERDLKPETIARLTIAEQRSFLVEITRGEIDKNTQERLTKYQLNPILSPKWGLPTARRGIAQFKPSEVDLIFDPTREAEFEIMKRAWVERLTAPFFGKNLKARSTKTDLFGGPQ